MEFSCCSEPVVGGGRGLQVPACRARPSAAARAAEPPTGGVSCPEEAGAGGERAPGRGLGVLAPAGTYSRRPRSCVWACNGPLASWVDPDKCLLLSGPPIGNSRALESLRRVRRRGLDSELEAGTSPLTGDFGLVTQPLGSLCWSTRTVVQRISKKTWSA